MDHTNQVMLTHPDRREIGFSSIHGTITHEEQPVISRISKLAFAILATVGLVMFIPVSNASAATAQPSINQVTCNDSGFLWVWWHPDGASPRANQTCLANAGTISFNCSDFGQPVECWLDQFSTGNNVVQYHGDSNWNPATPVGKFTTYGFPNHPGGVEFDAIKIF